MVADSILSCVALVIREDLEAKVFAISGVGGAVSNSAGIPS